jgi:hypothetical protein
MYIQRLAIPITTAADGSATAFSAAVTGKVVAVIYAKTDFSDGVDFTVTAEATGETIWAENDVNASAVRYPRAATHGTDGSAALYAAAGTAVRDKVALAADRVKVVVASGGNAKSGTVYVVVE